MHFAYDLRIYEGPEMPEVSSLVFRFLSDAVRDRGFDPESVLDGLPIQTDQLHNLRQRYAWDDFVEVLERVKPIVGGNAQLETLGALHFESPYFEFLSRIGRMFLSARDLYWLGTIWHGRALFMIIDDKFEDLDDGMVRVTLEIPKDYRPSEAFFHLVRGTIRSGPRIFGQGDSVVDLEFSERKAVYTIKPPPSQKVWTRFARASRAVFASKSVIDELSQQQSELQLSYRDLRTANRQVAAQARFLEIINQFGQELSRKTELEDLGQTIVDLLRTRFTFRGICIVLGNGEDEPFSMLRYDGELGPGEPNHYSFVAGARVVGKMHIWDPEPLEDERSLDLVDGLIPWISVALANARSFRAIRDVAAVLETRVDERTGELRSTNERLREEIRQREASQKQLIASERLASIGTLAAGIAHEINNPVGSILAFAEYANASQDDPEGAGIVNQALQDIMRESKRCGRIVRSVLQFARDERTEKWVEDLNTIVERTVQLADSYARERQSTIRLELHPDAIWASINPIEIEQAMVNLIRNALEAAPSQVEITVRTEIERKTARLSVTDNGRGIGDDDLARIFDPFYSTHRGSGGTGLGLSIVHGIVEDHGGKISVRSEEKLGTTIQIDLPLDQPPMEHVDA